ncbi:MAG TPA: class I poly(R)-hydroxyalkanoic acid synthase [Casimicrobiaceae bacterium]|jgi:polyhydroxyalkanoate synthase|nr:class I poly(R)-hydroxyalkanoic acid synthase [Casimicrobiaceae bacterium]
METQTSANDWTELLGQWQAIGQQWTHWWSRGEGSPMPVAAPPLEIGNAALAVLAPTAAWIDPAAAAELTERYNRRFETLWQRAVAGNNVSPTAAGAHAAAPDRRFGAKEWREHRYFTWLRDAYLLYADYVRELAALAQGDPESRKRVRFLARQYADAIAPSNFLATNPEALKLAIESGGASVAQGLANLIGDAQRGRIAMTDESAFEVGGNLALSPGRVVFRNELIELIQYAPVTAEVYERPLLLVPPCINKYYILDLRPENSFVRHIVGAGHTAFMISWRNIAPELGHLTWDDYLEQGVLQAIGVAREISRSRIINALGFCVGGTLLACSLAVLAARREHPVASATFLTTMLDFADPGEIGVYVSHESLAAREPALLAGARVHGSELANAFASLRPNELVWNYVVSNYLKGRTPPPFDLLYWNSDSANLPGPMYAYYLRNMYLDNRLREPRGLTMCGEPIDLSRIAMPSYVYASREDHIVPWRSAYRTIELIRGDVSFVLGASGHIAGVVNPPQKKKRNFWTNALLTDDPDEWLARAQSHPGSWWPNWTEWLVEHAGARRPAPTREGSARHRPLGPAPGIYVREKVA